MKEMVTITTQENSKLNDKKRLESRIKQLEQEVEDSETKVMQKDELIQQIKQEFKNLLTTQKQENLAIMEKLETEFNNV